MFKSKLIVVFALVFLCSGGVFRQAAAQSTGHLPDGTYVVTTGTDNAGKNLLVDLRQWDTSTNTYNPVWNRSIPLMPMTTGAQALRGANPKAFFYDAFQNNIIYNSPVVSGTVAARAGLNQDPAVFLVTEGGQGILVLSHVHMPLVTHHLPAAIAESENFILGISAEGSLRSIDALAEAGYRIPIDSSQKNLVRNAKAMKRIPADKVPYERLFVVNSDRAGAHTGLEFLLFKETATNFGGTEHVLEHSLSLQHALTSTMFGRIHEPYVEKQGHVVADDSGAWVLVQGTTLNAAGKRRREAMLVYFDFALKHLTRIIDVPPSQTWPWDVQFLAYNGNKILAGIGLNQIDVIDHGKSNALPPLSLGGVRSFVSTPWGWTWTPAGSASATSASAVSSASNVSSAAPKAATAQTAVNVSSKKPSAALVAKTEQDLLDLARQNVVSYLLTPNPELWKFLKAINQIPQIRDALIAGIEKQSVPADIWSSFVEKGQPTRTSKPAEAKLILMIETDSAGRKILAPAPGIEDTTRVSLADFHVVLSILRGCGVLLI